MTYKEIYNAVCRYSKGSRMENVAYIAQLVYTHGYRSDKCMTKRDAVFTALEIYEDMTGYYYDPTHEEYDDIVAAIIDKGAAIRYSLAYYLPDQSVEFSDPQHYVTDDKDDYTRALQVAAAKGYTIVYAAAANR